MRLGRVLYPVKALGPGNRLAIWVQGCHRNCVGCANPELQSFEKREIPIELLEAMALAAIRQYSLDGITISGGEPMLQAKDICQLLDSVLPYCNDVLVFTGYGIDELNSINDPNIAALLAKIAVLVDGPYIEELNRGEILRGSCNQHIIILKKEFEKRYNEYLRLGRHVIDNFIAQDGVISVGIHPKGFFTNE